MDIETLRAGIPALKEAIFFNTAGAGPIPSVVADEVVDLIRLQEAKGRYRPGVDEVLNGRAEDARGITARFFGVTPEEITFTHSISEGLNTVSEGLDWKAGDEVIISDQEHTSGHLPWAVRAEQQSLVLKQLRLLPEPEEMVERLRELLTERTRVVALSHVTSGLGLRVPAAELVRIGHEAGALVGFDGAQSAGQFPIDLRQIDCDFYTTTGYKWLLGPYGMGALYVKRDVLPQITVRRSGSRAGQADTARKFEFGARNLPLRIGYGRALRYIEEIGLEAIEARVQETVGYVKERVSEIPGARVQTPAGFSAGAVNVAIEGADPGALCRLLWERHKIVAVSPAGGLRLSVVFFTLQEEVDRLVEALKQAIN